MKVEVTSKEYEQKLQFIVRIEIGIKRMYELIMIDDIYDGKYQVYEMTNRNGQGLGSYSRKIYTFEIYPIIKKKNCSPRLHW